MASDCIFDYNPTVQRTETVSPLLVCPEVYIVNVNKCTCIGDDTKIPRSPPRAAT